jgi:ankyrin repeat protein
MHPNATGGAAERFIRAACVPMDAHASGTVAEAEAILASHPEVAGGSIQAASILGDEASVRSFLARDPGCATTSGGPYGWDPLTYLCFSRYLRLDRGRSEAFVRTAAALLDAGAPAHTGFHDKDHQPDPAFESAIYGAAGIAHHAGLTQLLLERGADPNDEETPYHTPESYDNAALEALVESGKLTADSLATMLLRKHDWHDSEGIRYLLGHGADPNRATRWGRTAFGHAVLRDNSLEIVELVLEHGGDPTLPAGGVTAAMVAARRGRGDLLTLFQRRGIGLDFQGIDRLLAACALGDAAAARSLAAGEPALVRELLAHAAEALAGFAGNGNSEGVGLLLDLGVPVDGRYEGEGYWDVARDSAALHVAAWRARHSTVRLLIERGAPVELPDGKGRTPLALAVRACVDSYWTRLRSPESVEALLRAGARPDGAAFPSGYAEVDRLLERHGAGVPGSSI